MRLKIADRDRTHGCSLTLGEGERHHAEAGDYVRARGDWSAFLEWGEGGVGRATAPVGIA